MAADDIGYFDIGETAPSNKRVEHDPMRPLDHPGAVIVLFDRAAGRAHAARRMHAEGVTSWRPRRHDDL